MAIIDSVPGLQVTVKIDGAAATEYRPPDGDDGCSLALNDFDVPSAHDQGLPYVVNYIEAKPGARYWFSIHKQHPFRRRGHHIAEQLSLDGLSTGLLHEPDYGRSSPVQSWIFDSDSYWTGDSTIGYRTHYFRFAAFDIVESLETGQPPSEAFERQKSLAQRCGTLKVSFFRMQKSELENSVRISRPSDQHDTKIVEKALKGKTVDSFTDFFSEPITPPQPKQIDRYSDSRKRPFAVFEFRYRTREGLMREGIIPRPSIADQVQRMTEDELRHRLAQIMEERERSATSSDQKDHPDATPDRRIKREAEEIGEDEFVARYKARRLENGRLEVDLTED